MADAYHPASLPVSTTAGYSSDGYHSLNGADTAQPVSWAAGPEGGVGGGGGDPISGGAESAGRTVVSPFDYGPPPGTMSGPELQFASQPPATHLSSYSAAYPSVFSGQQSPIYVSHPTGSNEDGGLAFPPPPPPAPQPPSTYDLPYTHHQQHNRSHSLNAARDPLDFSQHSMMHQQSQQPHPGVRGPAAAHHFRHASDHLRSSASSSSRGSPALGQQLSSSASMGALATPFRDGWESTHPTMHRPESQVSVASKEAATSPHGVAAFQQMQTRPTSSHSDASSSMPGTPSTMYTSNYSRSTSPSAHSTLSMASARSSRRASPYERTTPKKRQAVSRQPSVVSSVASSSTSSTTSSAAPSPSVATGGSTSKSGGSSSAVPSPFQGSSAAAEDDDQDNSPFAPGSSYNFITRPPGPGKSKSKLSDEQKRELCQLKALWPKSKQEDIARAYGVERSTVSKILGEKARWLANSEEEYLQMCKAEAAEAKDVRRGPNHKFPELEKPMADWVQRILNLGRTPSEKQIQEEALSLAKRVLPPKTKFKASPGWVSKFRTRHGLKDTPAPPTPAFAAAEASAADGSKGLKKKKKAPVVTMAENMMEVDHPGLGSDEDAEGERDDDEDEDEEDASYSHIQSISSSATASSSLPLPAAINRPRRSRRLSRSLSYGSLTAVIEDEPSSTSTASSTIPASPSATLGSALEQSTLASPAPSVSVSGGSPASIASSSSRQRTTRNRSRSGASLTFTPASMREASSAGPSPKTAESGAASPYAPGTPSSLGSPYHAVSAAVRQPPVPSHTHGTLRMVPSKLMSPFTPSQPQQLSSHHHHQQSAHPHQVPVQPGYEETTTTFGWGESYIPTSEDAPYQPYATPAHHHRPQHHAAHEGGLPGFTATPSPTDPPGWQPVGPPPSAVEDSAAYGWQISHRRADSTSTAHSSSMVRTPSSYAAQTSANSHLGSAYSGSPASIRGGGGGYGQQLGANGAGAVRLTPGQHAQQASPTHSVRQYQHLHQQQQMYSHELSSGRHHYHQQQQQQQLTHQPQQYQQQQHYQVDGAGYPAAPMYEFKDPDVVDGPVYTTISSYAHLA